MLGRGALEICPALVETSTQILQLIKKIGTAHKFRKTINIRSAILLKHNTILLKHGPGFKSVILYNFIVDRSKAEGESPPTPPPPIMHHDPML